MGATLQSCCAPTPRHRSTAEDHQRHPSAVGRAESEPNVAVLRLTALRRISLAKRDSRPLERKESGRAETPVSKKARGRCATPTDAQTKTEARTLREDLRRVLYRKDNVEVMSYRCLSRKTSYRRKSGATQRVSLIRKLARALQSEPLLQRLHRQVWPKSEPTLPSPGSSDRGSNCTDRRGGTLRTLS